MTSLPTKLTAGALLSLALLSGCGKSFLDLKPVDRITTENFYQTESDALQAVTACYSQLGVGGQYNYALWGIGEIMSDNSFTGGGGGGDGAEEIQLDFSTFRLPTPWWAACGAAATWASAPATRCCKRCPASPT
ncbi:MAG: hypothetical protein WKG07_32040 [Hymenobacter sp.]